MPRKGLKSVAIDEQTHKLLRLGRAETQKEHGVLVGEAMRLYVAVRNEAEKREIPNELDIISAFNLLLSRNAVPEPANDFSTGVTKAKKGTRSTGLNVSIGTSIIPNEAAKLWEDAQVALSHPSEGIRFLARAAIDQLATLAKLGPLPGSTNPSSESRDKGSGSKPAED